LTNVAPETFVIAHSAVRFTIIGIMKQWIFLAVALGGATVASRASALGNVGIDVGLAQRGIDFNNKLPPVFAFGAHAEVDLGSLFRVGPYFLHYELPSDHDVHLSPPGFSDLWYEKGTFNTVGVRARFVLPIPGPLKPQASLGLGRAWVTHHLGTSFTTSHGLVEVPVSVGATYEVNDLLLVSLDAAYRPAVLYVNMDDDGENASFGTSLLVGVSLGF
jgi:hypothetical protein